MRTQITPDNLLRPIRVRDSEVGFTLIELTLAISILAVMVMLNYKSLSGLIEAKLLLDDKRDGMYIANSLLTRLARELQLIVQPGSAPGPIISCSSIGPASPPAAQAPPTGPKITFQADSTGIGSSAQLKKITFIAEEAGQYILDGGTRSGLVQLTYRLEEDPENKGLANKGLILVRDEIPYRSDPRKACPGLITFPIAKNVSKIEFQFFDKKSRTWSPEWGVDKGTRVPDIIQFKIAIVTPQGSTESYTTSVPVR